MFKLYDKIKLKCIDVSGKEVWAYGYVSKVTLGTVTACYWCMYRKQTAKFFTDGVNLISNFPRLEPIEETELDDWEDWVEEMWVPKEVYE